MTVPICAGDDMDDWGLDLHEFIVQFAKEWNCTEVRGIGVRKGWLKKMSFLGWEEGPSSIKLKIGG